MIVIIVDGKITKKNHNSEKVCPYISFATTKTWWLVVVVHSLRDSCHHHHCAEQPVPDRIKLAASIRSFV